MARGMSTAIVGTPESRRAWTYGPGMHMMRLSMPRARIASTRLRSRVWAEVLRLMMSRIRIGVAGAPSGGGFGLMRAVPRWGEGIEESIIAARAESQTGSQPGAVAGARRPGVAG